MSPFNRSLLLPLISKGFQFAGLGKIPTAASRAYSIIGKKVPGYQPGASLRLSSYSCREIVADFFLLKNQIEAARMLAVPPNLKSTNREQLEALDMAGNTVGFVERWQAHKLGIRHKTVNVILVSPDGRIILQKRSETKDVFPGRYTVSAGGHMALNNSAKRGVPLRAIQRELKEELGLDISDAAKFVPLGDGKQGIPNFLKVWKYEKEGLKLTITQFDSEARHVDIRVKAGALSNADKDKIVALIRAAEAGRNVPNLKLTLFNVELCHYFMARVTDEEIRRINFADGEADGLKLVDLKTMQAMGEDISTTTDSLFNLFGANANPQNIESLNRFVAATQKANTTYAISPENLVFFRSLEKQIIQFDKDVSPAIRELLPTATILADHFYLASNGPDAYSEFSAHILDLKGKKLKETDHKGRRFGVLELATPIAGIKLVEMGEPIPGKPEPNRLAHIAYVLTGKNSDVIFAELLDKLERASEPFSLCGEGAQISFKRRDMWGNPPELTGLKMNVRVNGIDHEVEIRKHPL